MTSPIRDFLNKALSYLPPIVSGRDEINGASAALPSSATPCDVQPVRLGRASSGRLASAPFISSRILSVAQATTWQPSAPAASSTEAREVSVAAPAVDEGRALAASAKRFAAAAESEEAQVAKLGGELEAAARSDDEKICQNGVKIMVATDTTILAKALIRIDNDALCARLLAPFRFGTRAGRDLYLEIINKIDFFAPPEGETMGVRIENLFKRIITSDVNDDAVWIFRGALHLLADKFPSGRIGDRDLSKHVSGDYPQYGIHVDSVVVGRNGQMIVSSRKLKSETSDGEEYYDADIFATRREELKRDIERTLGVNSEVSNNMLNEAYGEIGESTKDATPMFDRYLQIWRNSNEE